MSTWSLPSESKSAARLRKLLDAPMAAAAATERLYTVLGDDALFDTIEGLADLDPERDVRPLVVARLNTLVRSYDRNRIDVRGGWNPDALAVCRSLITKFI